MSSSSPPPPPPPLEFPPIEPSNFDLITIGTGLPQSILSSAASSAAKSVLHLDPLPFYGSLFSSLSPPHHLSSLQIELSRTFSSDDEDECDVVPLSSHSLITDIETSSHEFEPSRTFSLDVAGPRVLFCADSAINLMLKSGVAQYLEFKSVDSVLIYDCVKRKLASVPDSRAAIFTDRSLKLTEKTQMMSFFKLVQKYLEKKVNDDGDDVISDDDLESPFVEFLSKMRLPDKIKSIILYAIAMADYDQENLDTCKDPLKTKVGIDRLALYHSSIGRFPNAPGAMLYPMYGQGELPQAFCRRAAVKGCIYVLRMPVVALLVDKGSQLYKGVRLASGQDIFSQKLVMDPQLIIPQGSALSRPIASEGFSKDPRPGDIRRKVARGICVTKTSLKPDGTNLLIVYPPKSLYPEQAASVRALQLGGNVAVCPVGMFVLYLSVLCDDASQGKKLLSAAINALFRQPVPEGSETSSSDNSEETSVAQSTVEEGEKPTLLWSTLYIQEVTEESVEEAISICPSPDGNLGYNDLIHVSEKMFCQMYPDEEFFPESTSTEDHEDADGDNCDPRE